jgi:hypothetical protein
MTMTEFTADDIIGIFLHGLTRLQVDDDGLVPDANDPDDLHTIGTLAVLTYRIASRGDTPRDLALSRLAVTTGGLIASQWLGGGESIVREWSLARVELLELDIPRV